MFLTWCQVFFHIICLLSLVHILIKPKGRHCFSSCKLGGRVNTFSFSNFLCFSKYEHTLLFLILGIYYFIFSVNYLYLNYGNRLSIFQKPSRLHIPEFKALVGTQLLSPSTRRPRVFHGDVVLSVSLLLLQNEKHVWLKLRGEREKKRKKTVTWDGHHLHQTVLLWGDR